LKHVLLVGEEAQRTSLGAFSAARARNEREWALSQWAQ